MSRRQANQGDNQGPTRGPMTRRQLIGGGLTLGGAALLFGACDTAEAAEATGATDTTQGGSCEIAVDPNYDGGQVLYRRNDGGKSAGTSDPRNAVSEGQTYGDMIIKSSAMYQTHGHVSHMETSVGPKTIIAPHVHENADQLVIILGVVDEATAHGDDTYAATAKYEVDPTYGPMHEPVALKFQFDPQDPNAASEVISCPVGSYVLKPRGRTHAFWNPTNKRIAYCEISTGTDFEVFVRGSEDVESIADLEALEKAGNTYFEDPDVLARLMFEHMIPNVKGMGGLNDAVQDIKSSLAEAIKALAAAKGVPVPPELLSITLDTD